MTKTNAKTSATNKKVAVGRPSENGTAKNKAFRIVMKRLMSRFREDTRLIEQINPDKDTWNQSLDKIIHDFADYLIEGCDDDSIKRLTGGE